MGSKTEALSEHWGNGQRGTDHPNDQRKVLKLIAFQPSFQHTEIVARGEGNGKNYWPREKDKLVVLSV